MPPFFCASAMTCSASVVLPELSGPKISTMRPRGRPPMPSAISRPSEPVEIDFDLGDGALAELHHRALAEVALDLAERRGQRLVLIHGTLDNAKRRGCSAIMILPYSMPRGARKARWPVHRMYLVCSHFVSKDVNGRNG